MTTPQIRRRRDAALAGHLADEDGARVALADDAGSVRATALGALARMNRLGPADVVAGTTDASENVRRRACELSPLTAHDPVVEDAVVAALADHDVLVVEAACYGLGELGSRARPGTVDALARVATTHPDPLGREAAVAALGAIGDAAGLPAILAATADKPAIRRRAVLALAPFAGPEVDGALARARSDRDWQVRQAAEDLENPASGCP
jgi:HEAT repeat protein